MKRKSSVDIGVASERAGFAGRYLFLVRLFISPCTVYSYFVLYEIPYRRSRRIDRYLRSGRFWFV